MFDKIQMILMMKTSISNNPKLRLNKNANRSIGVKRNNFVSQSRFSVLNCHVINNISNNVLDKEINTFNVLKTRSSNTTRPIQNIVQIPRRPPVVVNNSRKPA